MNQLDAEHQTALMWAAAFGHAAVVEGLVSRDAKVWRLQVQQNRCQSLAYDWWMIIQHLCQSPYSMIISYDNVAFVSRVILHRYLSSVVMGIADIDII